MNIVARILLSVSLSALLIGPTAAGTCMLLDEICVEPNETRAIDGVEVFRNCWRYQARYQCLGTATIDNCDALREAECSQIDSSCLTTDDNGNCVSYEQTYRCPTSPETSTEVLTCGNSMACIDNNCFDTSSPPNQDFALAATHLNVMKEASKDFDVDNLQIFKGRELGCSKAFLSYSDCCGDNGWGLDLEVTSCSDEEKELVQAARAESCHLVGSYCSNDNFFGICTSTRLEWCCFSSKLARIVNEQGRPQLAKGWGTPKSPDCSGFTPDELQQLDFAAMDLSEFYDDVMAQAKGMDVNQLSQTVTDRVTDYYETGTYSIPESQATSYDTSIAPPP